MAQGGEEEFVVFDRLPTADKADEHWKNGNGVPIRIPFNVVEFSLGALMNAKDSIRIAIDSRYANGVTAYFSEVRATMDGPFIDEGGFTYYEVSPLHVYGGELPPGFSSWADYVNHVVTQATDPNRFFKLPASQAAVFNQKMQNSVNAQFATAVVGSAAVGLGYSAAVGVAYGGASSVPYIVAMGRTTYQLGRAGVQLARVPATNPHVVNTSLHVVRQTARGPMVTSLTRIGYNDALYATGQIGLRGSDGLARAGWLAHSATLRAGASYHIMTTGAGIGYGFVSPDPMWSPTGHALLTGWDLGTLIGSLLSVSSSED